MNHNILIAGKADVIGNNMHRKVADGLRTSARLSYAGEQPMVTVVSDMETVDDYISDGDITVLIITETVNSIEDGRDIIISKAQISAWADAYPDMLVILLLNSHKKGGIKLKKLFETEYYNVLFEEDFKFNKIVEFIQCKGRDKEEAFEYYGLSNNSTIEEVGNKNRKSKDSPAVEVSGRKTKPQKKGFVYNPTSDDDYGEEYMNDDLEYPSHEKSPFKRMSSDVPRTTYRNENDDENYDEEYDEGYAGKEIYDVEEAVDFTEEEEWEEDKFNPVCVPAPKGYDIFFGEIMRVREDNTMIVNIPLAAGASLDHSFVGTKVYFMGKAT